MDIQTHQRIVIKVGSALLVDGAKDTLRTDWMASLVADIASLKQRGKEVILVSSGSVALGKQYLDLPDKGKLKLEQKQAAAAVGQIELCKHYQHFFTSYKLITAQILLTIPDTERRRRYLNAKNTLDTLLENNIVPIINENDTIATNEIRYGDNDRLAARVAQMVDADLLILLSDVDGLYTKDPSMHDDAVHIPLVDAITPEIDAMGGKPQSGVGSGGMHTKIEAAKIATMAGCHTLIAKGFGDHPVKQIEEGARCTWFTSHETPISARKHWIASHLDVQGEIVVDKGALNALYKGKSLLPAGVIAVKGHFERGDAVLIRDWQNNPVGKGLIAFASDDAEIIRGQQGSAIEHLLGFSGRVELIHSDNLVMTQKEEDVA